MKKTHLLAGAAAGLALAAALPAAAQSIDYGSLEQLFNEPVTTSATGSPQRSSQAPVAMQIITADDIARSGATDLPTILSRATGVDILTWAGGGATDVGVRGYDAAYSSRLLVLVNGRQVYLDHYGYTVWSALPVALSEIRQIEVVRGPNSALFGFNAVSGVINIITYNPKFDATNKVEVAGGANGFGAGSLVATLKPNDRFGVRMSLSAGREDQWDSVGKVTRPVFSRDPERAAANLDSVIALGSKSELRLEGSWSNVRQSEMSPTYSFAASKYLTQSVRAQLNSETPYGLITLGAYQNQVTMKALLNSGFYRYENKISVVQAQDLFKPSNATTVRLGLEYRHNELNTQPVAGGMVTYEVLAPSAMINWAATDKLSLTAAVRYDRLKLSRSGVFPPAFPNAKNSLYDKTMTETTANIGAVYAATPNDSFRLSFARGAQVPTLVELGGIDLPYKVGPFTIAVIGTADTRPTIVTSYELGYDRDLPQLNAKVGLGVFTQKTTDLKGMPDVNALDFAPTATSYPGIMFAKNVADSRVTGLEVHASGKTSANLRWAANWTQTQIKMDAYKGQNLAARQILFNQITPKTRINLNLGWSDADWSIDGYARYVSKFKTDAYKGWAGDYVSLAGRVARTFGPGLTAAVVVENALQDNDIQDSPAAPERRAFVQISKTW